MSHIFISYSRRDIDFAQKIVTVLGDSNLDTWIDWKSIPKGEDWEQEIYRGIEEADAFLFLISPDSVTSEMCNKEIAHAVKNGKRILPIVIRDTDPKIIHPEISKRNWIFCRDGQDDFNKAIEETRNTIHTDYEWLKYHTELQVKALRWEQKKDNSRLLRGKELREAELQLAEINGPDDPQPTKLQREYIFASQRNEIRTRRQITIGLVVGLGIMVVLSFVAWGQRNSAISAQNTAVAEANAKATALVNEENARATAEAERNRAEKQAKIALSRQLAAQASSIQQSNLDTSLLLSLEALKIENTIEARNSLLRAIQTSPTQGFLYNSKPINSLAFSPNGKIIATGGEGGTITLWNTSNHVKIVELLTESQEDIYCIRFSPDGKTLVVASGKNIYLLDVGTQEFSTSIIQADTVREVTINPDGRILAFVTGDNKISFWDMNTQQVIGKQMVGHTGIRCITFSPDGKFIITGNDDGTITRWDVQSNEQLGTPVEVNTQNPNPVFSIAFSPDGKLLAAGGGQGYGYSNYDFISLLDTATYQPFYDPIEGYLGDVYSVVFSPDSQILAAGHYGGLVTFWDVSSGKQKGASLMGDSYAVYSVDFSPDGMTVASGGSDQRVVLWNSLSFSFSSKPLDISSNITNLKFNRDGKKVIVSSCVELSGTTCSQSRIDFWDINLDKPAGTILTDQPGLVYSIDPNPNGDTLAVGNENGSIDFWSLLTLMQEGASLTRRSGSVISLAYNPDGSILASTYSDSTIVLWNTDTKSIMGLPLNGYAGYFNKVIFSPNGKFLAYGSPGENVLIWDISNPISPISLGWALPYYNGGLVFSSDSQTIVYGSQDNIIIWDLQKNQIMEQLNNNPGKLDSLGIESIAISPDGLTLAVGSCSRRMGIYCYKGQVTLWDIQTHQQLGYSFTEHPCQVTSVAFSPDGRVLASAGCGTTLPKLAGIMNGSGDQFAVLWDMDLNNWEQLACWISSRNFTQTEWTQYFSNEPYRLTCPQWPAGE